MQVPLQQSPSSPGNLRRNSTGGRRMSGMAQTARSAVSGLNFETLAMAASKALEFWMLKCLRNGFHWSHVFKEVAVWHQNGEAKRSKVCKVKPFSKIATWVAIPTSDCIIGMGRRRLVNSDRNPWFSWIFWQGWYCKCPALGILNVILQLLLEMKYTRFSWGMWKIGHLYHWLYPQKLGDVFYFWGGAFT